LAIIIRIYHDARSSECQNKVFPILIPHNTEKSKQSHVVHWRLYCQRCRLF